MAVWQYPDVSRDSDIFWPAGINSCIFCGLSLIDTKRKSPEWINVDLNGVFVCPCCGWWKAQQIQWKVEPHQHTRIVYGAVASLCELDLSDKSTPINDIRTYLVAKYESRKTVNPKLFEDTVASVFSSLGYKTQVTGYSRDGGIDIIMYKDNEIVGVQVKRYKNKIKVEQIRSLAGALVLAGITKGIFVTTSDFQSGAAKTVAKFDEKGYSIDLYNAADFYDALKLAQCNREAVVASLDRSLIMANIVEVERTYEANPHGP